MKDNCVECLLKYFDNFKCYGADYEFYIILLWILLNIIGAIKIEFYEHNFGFIRLLITLLRTCGYFELQFAILKFIFFLNKFHNETDIVYNWFYKDESHRNLCEKYINFDILNFDYEAIVFLNELNRFNKHICSVICNDVLLKNHTTNTMERLKIDSTGIDLRVFVNKKHTVIFIPYIIKTIEDTMTLSEERKSITIRKSFVENILIRELTIPNFYKIKSETLIITFESKSDFGLNVLGKVTLFLRLKQQQDFSVFKTFMEEMFYADKEIIEQLKFTSNSCLFDNNSSAVECVREYQNLDYISTDSIEESNKLIREKTYKKSENKIHDRNVEEPLPKLLIMKEDISSRKTNRDVAIEKSIDQLISNEINMEENKKRERMTQKKSIKAQNQLHTSQDVVMTQENIHNFSNENFGTKVKDHQIISKGFTEECSRRNVTCDVMGVSTKKKSFAVSSMQTNTKIAEIQSNTSQSDDFQIIENNNHYFSQETVIMGDVHKQNKLEDLIVRADTLEAITKQTSTRERLKSPDYRDRDVISFSTNTNNVFKVQTVALVHSSETCSNRNRSFSQGIIDKSTPEFTARNQIKPVTYSLRKHTQKSYVQQSKSLKKKVTTKKKIEPVNRICDILCKKAQPERKSFGMDITHIEIPEECGDISSNAITEYEEFTENLRKNSEEFRSALRRSCTNENDAKNNFDVSIDYFRGVDSQDSKNHYTGVHNRSKFINFSYIRHLKTRPNTINFNSVSTNSMYDIKSTSESEKESFELVNNKKWTTSPLNTLRKRVAQNIILSSSSSENEEVILVDKRKKTRTKESKKK